MAFPQPPSIGPVLNSQDYWRLKTFVESPGDIYESEVGALSFALGPDSDIANMQLTYYDQSNEPGLVTTATLSPDRSFVGRIDASMSQVYPGPGARKARILISVGDLYSETYRPPLFAGGDEINFVKPMIDVIQYFNQQPSLIPQRADKTFRFQYFERVFSATDSTWLCVPVYNRKSGFVSIVNRDQAALTFSVFGVKLSMSMPPGSNGSVTSLLFTQALAAVGDQAIWPFNSSVAGIWDMFCFRITGGGVGGYDGGAMPLTLTLSDDAL